MESTERFSVCDQCHTAALAGFQCDTHQADIQEVLTWFYGPPHGISLAWILEIPVMTAAGVEVKEHGLGLHWCHLSWEGPDQAHVKIRCVFPKMRRFSVSLHHFLPLFLALSTQM